MKRMLKIFRSDKGICEHLILRDYVVDEWKIPEVIQKKIGIFYQIFQGLIVGFDETIEGRLGNRERKLKDQRTETLNKWKNWKNVKQKREKMKVRRPIVVLEH